MKGPLFVSCQFQGRLRFSGYSYRPWKLVCSCPGFFFFFFCPASKWTEVSVTTTGGSRVNEKPFVHRNKRKFCLEMLFKHITHLCLAYILEKSRDKHYRTGGVLPDWNERAVCRICVLKLSEDFTVKIIFMYFFLISFLYIWRPKKQRDISDPQSVAYCGALKYKMFTQY